MFLRFALAFACIGSLGAAGPAREGLLVPMRDGVRLAGDLYRSSKTSRLPTILIRTPYGKGSSLSRNQQEFVERGFAVLIQDVRGRYASGGTFEPFRQEIADADDTLNWIAAQPWSNGSVGMMGGSYLGIVQWKAALSGNPHLKAIFPVVSGFDDYFDRYYSPGGALKWGHRLSWMASNMRAPGHRTPPFESYVRSVPIQEADRAATGQPVAFFQEVLRHPDYNRFWHSVSTRAQIANVRTPVFAVGGWYDNFVESDLEVFAMLRHLGREAHLLVGPWPHNMSTPLPGVDFGKNSSAPVLRHQLDWFARWLKGDRDKGRFPPLRIFVMGANQWRDEQEWPLARATMTPFYLVENRKLRRQPPRRVSVEHYTYDPANPTPTRGGAVCCNPNVFAWGPMDQTVVEQRPDVLVFTTEPLTEDVEVTGPIRAILDVSTSARDTDFTAKLVDVYPDGRAINLCDGILRLRYREGLDHVVLAAPGQRYRITVDAGVTANVFKAGHRIRVEIASSNFPRFDRNFNTGGIQATERRMLLAEQSVYLKDSHILLPVVR